MKKLFTMLMCVFLSACNAAQSGLLEDSVVTLPVPPTLTNNLKALPVATPFKTVRNISVRPSQVVRLEGVVGENIEPVIKRLEKLNRKHLPVIYLLIDSPGGSVFDGAKLLSTIQASRTPIYTVCLSMCASMAAIIHQYGSKRLMQDRSVLMFHDASGALQGTLPQMKTRLDFISGFTTKMDAFIAQRAGVDLGGFISQLRSEVWMDAEDSTSKKFNDEIVYVTVDGPEEQESFKLPFLEPDKKFDKFSLDNL